MRGTAPSGYANDTMKQQASTGFEREACQDDAPGTVPGARGQDDRVAGDGGDDQGSAVRFHGDTLPHLLHRKEMRVGATWVIRDRRRSAPRSSKCSALSRTFSGSARSDASRLSDSGDRRERSGTAILSPAGCWGLTRNLHRLEVTWH
jgi:hypothetical protein